MPVLISMVMTMIQRHAMNRPMKTSKERIICRRETTFSFRIDMELVVPVKFRQKPTMGSVE